MNNQPPNDQESDVPGYREELAAKIAVEKMLIRTRLEDAAKGPPRSVWLWIVCFVGAIILMFLGNRPEYQSIVLTFLAAYLLFGTCERQIHSRIDAILKLAELDKKEALAAAASADESSK